MIFTQRQYKERLSNLEGQIIAMGATPTPDSRDAKFEIFGMAAEKVMEICEKAPKGQLMKTLAMEHLREEQTREAKAKPTVSKPTATPRPAAPAPVRPAASAAPARPAAPKAGDHKAILAKLTGRERLEYIRANRRQCADLGIKI